MSREPFPISNFRFPIASPIGNRQLAIRKSPGFTLIEILVVLGIITLIAALGVPVYNALTGARSVEAAQNQVSAYLGQARTIAINEGKSAGLMFYVDPATERTAMAIVVVGDSTLEDPDPYEKYKGWTSGADYTTGDLDPNNDGNTSDRTRADRVIGFTADANSAFDSTSYPTQATGSVPTYTDPRRYIGNFRPAVKVWRAERTHTASSGVHPPRTGPYDTSGSKRAVSTITTYVQGTSSVSQSTTGTYDNNTWTLSTGKVISQYGNSEQQLLPKGIGVQVIIQPTSRTNSAAEQERYVRTGIILFDPQGRLVLRDLKLPKSTTLGEWIELGADAEQILTGVGVALYNQAAFKGVATPGGSASDMDWIYLNVPGNNYKISSAAAPFNDYPSSSFADEKAEEDWLANNTVPVLINRFSGSLSESE